MTNIDHQNAFLIDFAKLILKAPELGIMVTAGELMRSQEQQDLYLKTGKTTIKHSMHQDRRAGDLNFFTKVGDLWVLTYDKKNIQPLGDYWESLNPLNKWGGNWSTFVDVPHFQRNLS